jgi:hypothetical protein
MDMMLFTLTFQGIYVYTNNFETEGLASHRWACLRLCAAVADTGGNIIILPSVASMSRFRCLGQHGIKVRHLFCPQLNGHDAIHLDVSRYLCIHK